jgi:hypothetical protein
MRRLLNPTVGLITFLIGVLAASAWLVVQHPSFQKPEASPPASAANSIPVQINLETERHAVYSAVIRDMYAEDGTKLLVVSREAVCVPASGDEEVEELPDRMGAFAIKELRELKQDTIDDFRVTAKQCRSLSEQLDIPVKYVFVTEKEIERLFEKGGLGQAWEHFYSRYPNSSGIIGFSNVGFDREMNQALVATSRSCGSLCGAGHYVLLTKDNGVWKVHSKTMTWIS